MSMAINETINETINITTSAGSGLDTSTAWSFAKGYLLEIPNLIAQGDMFAIIVAMILGFILILILNKLTGVLLLILKKSVIFIITGLGVFYFYKAFTIRLAAEGWTISTALFGIIGIVVGILGIIIAFYALFYHTKEGIKARGDMSKIPEKELQSMTKMKDMFSLQSITNDKSLLSVMTFMVVAQFGVFSSKTISAPNINIGLGLFIIFMVGSFIFIKQSYKDYIKGLEHLGVVFIASLILCLVLGHFWAGFAWSILFSLGFFTTDCLVALISGMALSLFVGSKG